MIHLPTTVLEYQKLQCDKNNITNNNIDDDYDDDVNNVVDDDVDCIVAQCTLLFVETTKLSFFYFVLKAGRIALVNHVIIISFLFFSFRVRSIFFYYQCIQGPRRIKSVSWFVCLIVTMKCLQLVQHFRCARSSDMLIKLLIDWQL